MALLVCGAGSGIGSRKIGIVTALVCYALPPNVELTDVSSAAHIAVATYGDAASLAPDDH